MLFGIYFYTVDKVILEVQVMHFSIGLRYSTLGMDCVNCSSYQFFFGGGGRRGEEGKADISEKGRHFCLK